MSTGQIERKAVHAINETALQSVGGILLVPEIPVGDKGVSFDGAISVFRNGKDTVENWAGSVPVQVKGNNIEEFHPTNRTYSLELKHYHNYLTHGGVLFLVVEIKPNRETKIYYKVLLAMEISQIIESFGSQKSRTMELRPLDETSLHVICCKFLNERKHQPLTLVERKPFPFDSFSEYIVSSMTFNPSHPNTQSFFEHDFTIYGVQNETRFPLVTGRISVLDRVGIIQYITNGKSFSLLTEITLEENITKMVLERVVEIELDFKQKKFFIHFLGFHSLTAQLKVTPMLIELLEGNTIYFSDCSLTLNKNAKPIQEELEEARERLMRLHHLAHVFYELGIPVHTVFDDDNLLDRLEALFESYKQNELIRIAPTNPDHSSICNIELGGKQVVLFYNPSGEKVLINGFSEYLVNSRYELQDKSTGLSFRHSIFIILDKLCLLAVNMNPEVIKRSFDQVDPYINEDAFNMTNAFCLNCIAAYDKNDDPRLLNLAQYIYDKCPTNLRDYVVYINQLQIYQRIHGSFDETTQKEILRLKREAIKQDNYELLFCLNVLLQNKTEANDAYNELTKEQHKLYETLPIYSAYIRLYDI